MSKEVKIAIKTEDGCPSKQEVAEALKAYKVVGIPVRVLDENGWHLVAQVEEKAKPALKQVAKPKPKASAKKPSLGKKKDSE